MTERDVDELVRSLDKEEKEMDEGDDEDDDEESDKVLRDVKELGVVLEEELKEVVNLAKPVHQVLYKVSLRFVLFLFLIAVSLFFLDNTRLPSFFPRYLSPFFFFQSFFLPITFLLLLSITSFTFFFTLNSRLPSFLLDSHDSHRCPFVS